MLPLPRCLTAAALIPVVLLSCCCVLCCCHAAARCAAACYVVGRCYTSCRCSCAATRGAAARSRSLRRGRATGRCCVSCRCCAAAHCAATCYVAGRCYMSCHRSCTVARSPATWLWSLWCGRATGCCCVVLLSCCRSLRRHDRAAACYVTGRCYMLCRRSRAAAHGPLRGRGRCGMVVPQGAAGPSCRRDCAATCLTTARWRSSCRHRVCCPSCHGLAANRT